MKNLFNLINKSKNDDLYRILKGIWLVKNQFLFNSDLEFNKIQNLKINKENCSNLNNKNNNTINKDFNLSDEEINEIYNKRNDLNNNISKIESKIPVASYNRAFQFISVGANILGKGLLKKLINPNENFKNLIITEESSEILAQALLKMRGAALKLGQALSIQEDKLIPDKIRKAFDKARENAYIMPKKQLDRILIENFGKDWEKNITNFNHIPIASASIGQVHSAVYKNKKIVLKIQYPGVSKSIENDLWSLKKLLEIGNFVPKGLFIDDFIKVTKEELIEECDYLKEAKKQKKYKEFFENEFYYIPNIIDELTTKNILAQEEVEGIKFDDLILIKNQNIKNFYGNLLMKLCLDELFVNKYMQTDPNPSNFLFDLKNKRINLIDFGAARSYSNEFLFNYLKIIHNAAIENETELIDYSIKLGFITGEENKEMLNAHLESIKTIGKPFQKNDLYDFGKQNMTKEVYKKIPIMMKNRIKEPPQEIYSLHRKFAGVFLFNIKLKSQINCNKLFYEIYKNYNFN